MGEASASLIGITYKGEHMEIQSDYEQEMMKLNRVSTGAGGLAMPFKEHADHKNIPLYTALNKKIGGLAKANAIATMTRWKQAGHTLYMTPRTEQQIEAYKQTAFYKSEHKKHTDLRKKRHLASKGKSQDQMMQEMAVATGRAVAEAISKPTTKKKANVSS